jgi:hypothetical protein
MSIVVQQEDVTNVAPELASEGADRVALFTAIAQGYISECKWGQPKANQAAAILVAHLITYANRGASSGGAGGTITELKVGDVQQSFGSETPTSDAELATTNYGKLFLSLRRTVFTSPIIV